MSTRRPPDPEHWQRIQRVFVAALEAGPRTQAAVLDKACGGDLRLRQEVETLLAARVDADEFLLTLARRTNAPFGQCEHAPAAEGRRLGAYRVLREIGRGGMGVVYLGERADGEFEKQVAIKLLPFGLGSPAAKRRFLAEWRILARLEHPGIARLLDAGVDPDGIPFYVMEYVEGEPITRYSDRLECDIDQRLELFLQVCDSVEYAHSEQVVHRDLKPANILITAEGRVKLLDFGIAKVLDHAPASESTLTVWGGSPMTIAYASAEQILGEDIGFASDVFQLGILLYVLLTGRGPFDKIENRSWADLVRTIRDRRVVPPSIAAGLPGRQGRGDPEPEPEPTERAQRRRTRVRALRARLAGDIDAILLKALRAEPDRRYASVLAFAREIERYREGRPIAARLEAAVRSGRTERVEPIPSDPHSPSAARSPASGDDDRVVIFPFSVSAGRDMDYLGHGLVSLLAAALDGSGVLRPVETPRAPESFPASDPASDRTASASAGPPHDAEPLDARFFVRGDVAESAKGIRMTVSLHEVCDGAAPRAQAVVEGAVDDVVEMVDALAIRLLCAAAPPHRAELTLAAASSTASLVAFKQFLLGEQALGAGNFFAAAEALRAAVETDPEFAIGYYRLALAAFWAQNGGPARIFAAEAAARGEHLPPGPRQLVAALEHHMNGDAAEAERLYAALLAAAPNDLDAALLRGMLMFHQNALQGRPQSEARPLFERILAIRPDHVIALLFLSTLVAHSGDRRTLGMLTRRIAVCYPDSGPPGYPVVARAQLAFAGGDRRAQDEAIEELRSAGILAAVSALNVVSGLPDGFDGVDRITRLLTGDPEIPPQIRAAGHVVLAHLQWGRGRLGLAEGELDAAASLGSSEAREIRALLMLAPFLSVAREELERLRNAMLEWDGTDPPDAPPSIPHFAPHHGLHAPVRSFLLGLVHARLGEHEEALQHQRRLLDSAAASHEPALSSLAETVRTELELHRSGPVAALGVCEQYALKASFERYMSSSFFSHTHARFTRAEVLRAAGRSDEALAWYATFGESTVGDLAYVAPAHLRQAEILADRAERDRAADHYRRFLELWRDCDDALKPVADSARRALADLDLRRP